MWRIRKISNVEMDTASPQRMNGRGLNNDKMRPLYHSATGMLTTRSTENSLHENGAGEARTDGTETYTIGSGEVMENRQSILTHRNISTNNWFTNPLISDITQSETRKRNFPVEIRKRIAEKSTG